MTIDKERIVQRYLSALDRGDVSTIAHILSTCDDDVAEAILEVNCLLADEYEQLWLMHSTKHTEAEIRN